MQPPNRFSFLSLDLRSIALFRFLLGLLLIIDLFSRWPWLTDFYSDEGVLPRSALLAEFSNPYFFSLFHVAGKSIYLHLLFALGLLFYFSLMIGYKTRWANFFSWVFFVSLTARLPVAAHGGDDLIRVALFWLLFLPSQTFFSVDRALAPLDQKPMQNSLLSIAGLAFVVQLIVMYFSTALLKWHPIWHTESTAIYFALEIDQFLAPFGYYLKKLPLSALQFMTWITLWVELLVPLFFFIPWRNSQFRLVAIVTFLSFHFGLFLTFYLGTFPWICMFYWLALLPSSFWDFLGRKAQLAQKNIVIYYDSDCGYCRRMVSLFQTFLALPFVFVRKAQDDAKIYQRMKSENSWIVQAADGSLTSHYEAFLILLRASYLKPTLAFFQRSLIRKWGDKAYRYQAQHRSAFGRLLLKLHPQVPQGRKSFLIEAFALFCFALMIYWNVAVFNLNDRWRIPTWMDRTASILRLHQQWNMFAPYPWKEDGWYVVDGKLKNGSTWDILNDKPVNFEKPEWPAELFPNSPWRKYLLNIWHQDYSDHRLHFGRYLCRRWNKGRPPEEQVDTFEIYYMLEVSQPPGEPPSPIRKEQIWSHYCFEKPASGR